MSSITFKKWNTLLAWFSFAIAFIVYSLTVEPTASFWDAGEYIATSAKLQVGHPPGAPLFQMLGAFFSIFTFGNDSLVALANNMMSVAASAFTILFMFWTITKLLKKLVKEDEGDNGMIILGSAFIGSLAFAFTDSFWFNAVETEVYAMATLIMSVMFWLGLKWEEDMDTPRANKWLLLISFVIGLSFGVHFMGLLTIPAIGLIYYFKKYKKITVQGFLAANLIVVGILAFIFKVLLPTTLKVFSWSEVNLVNGLGLPFHSGTIICGLVFIWAFWYGLKKTRERGAVFGNTIILCLIFIFVGFSSWLMLPIRANANTVINENNPSSARELLAYYNLEQYPETKLLYGPNFTNIYATLDEEEPYLDEKPKYEKNKTLGKYEIVNDWKGAKQNSSNDHKGFLPRMWSSDHAENYMKYTGPLEFEIIDYETFRDGVAARFDLTPAQINMAYNDNRKEIEEDNLRFQEDPFFDPEELHKYLKETNLIKVKKPSFGDNLQFLLQYQLGYMYWRYFMWNFVGRQDDIQGKQDNHGNWISGIKFIDEAHLGLPQDNLPSDMAQNKGRNTYFFLPLILGLIGLFFLLDRDKKRFWVMLVFFLLTGLAIQVYTNIRPYEPRERDYSVVGSFYVFSIWIGFGIFAIYTFLKRYISIKSATAFTTAIGLLAGPLLLASQNWDDHDRSNRYTAQSMARVYLDSCQEDAILFTIGDNDTFALWYAQDIEGHRTDVRTLNTSLFQTDWYIDQMKRKAYESDPIPSQLTHDKYRYGTREYVAYEEDKRYEYMMIKDFIDFISSEDPTHKMAYALRKNGDDLSQYPRQYLNMNYFPTKNIRIPVNKENVLKYGIVDQKDADKIVPYIDIKLKGNALYKNRILMLDIIANNDWKRPIYFTGGSYGDDDFIWMKDYLELDGLGFKLVPIKTEADKKNPYDLGRIDSEKLYNKVMKWEWGNSGSPDIYHDPETRKNGITYRGNMARLVEKLIEEEKFDKAEKILDLGMEKMPISQFEYYTLVEPFISGYYAIGKKEKGKKYYNELADKYKEKLYYYSTFDFENLTYYGEEIITDLERYKSLIEVLTEYEDPLAEDEIITIFNYVELFKPFLFEVGYSVSLERFTPELYKYGKIDMAHTIFYDGIREYQDRLNAVSQFKPEEQVRFEKEILDDLKKYRLMTELPLLFNDTTLYKKESKIYNSYVDKFRFFFADSTDTSEDSEPIPVQEEDNIQQ